jgi:hypothetical protein
LEADPIPALLDAAIDAPTPFCGACEFRDQLSSVQESVGLATVLLTSCVFVPSRGEAGKSESRVEAGRDWLLAVRPLDVLLLSALPSQVAAQLSGAEAGRTVDGGDDDCGDVFVAEPKLGSPRYELVVSDGPLSKDIELSGATLFVGEGICGNNMGGAAIVEPMLLQPLLDGGGAGFANMLRSTGVTGRDESQLDAGGGAGVPELVGHGGGAELPVRVLEPAGGAAGCVVKGLVD